MEDTWRYLTTPPSAPENCHLTPWRTFVIVRYMTSDLCTTQAAAHRLGVSVRTVHRLVADGRLTPACKLDGPRGAYLFATDDVTALRAALERAA